jgi:putative phosphoesterase
VLLAIHYSLFTDIHLLITGSFMKIGVLSDTHLPDSGDAMAFLLDLAEEYFEGVELILHAGDVVSADVLEVFTWCPVHVVRGNMDPPVAGVPQKRVFEVEGVRIGMMHGWGPPEGIEARLLNEFRDSQLDCLVYGHSHLPSCHRRNGILLFNPGSATDRRSAAFHTVGLLTIEGGQIEGEIIRID